MPCIPGRQNRKQAIDYDKKLYRQRHKVENMFAKLKDWRRVSTRYDRCAHTFFPAIRIAAAVAFYLHTGFAFVHSGMHASAQLEALQPVQNEE